MYGRSAKLQLLYLLFRKKLTNRKDRLNKNWLFCVFQFDPSLPLQNPHQETEQLDLQLIIWKA